MNQKGFTLIELIIVVAIITILASVLIPAGSHARKRARMAKARSHIAALELGLSAYHSDFGTYPTNQSGGTTEDNNALIVELLSGFSFSGGSRSPSSEAIVQSNQWNGPYLDIDESDVKGAELVDPWGNPYNIVLDLDGDTSTSPIHNVYSFDISSGGPDGSVDGTEDITNW